MPSENFDEESKVNVNVIYKDEEIESSDSTLAEDWSSVDIDVPEENRKKILFQEGLYHPGSGEICAKYIVTSNSSILKHPYYNYPAVLDPGIKNALLGPEEKVIYSDDGEELYLDLCKKTEQAPIRSFAKGLFDEVIDLSYYGVNSNGVRVMSEALRYNRNVKTFNLTDSFLNTDACYHLGEMLTTNTTLVELNLSGCRIGAVGAMNLFAGLKTNRGLKVLNLNRNQLSDAGVEILANTLVSGMDVPKVYISYNNIGGKGASALAEALDVNNKFTHIDLSWNNLFTSMGTYSVLCKLGKSKVLQDLNISWNSISLPQIGIGIKKVMSAPNLRNLDLNNNKLSGEALTKVLAGLDEAKKLRTLNLSYNPLTPDDALAVLNKLKAKNVKVQKVLMDNVFVNVEFLTLLESIKQDPAKNNLVVTYGGVVGTFIPTGPDPRELLMNRAEFLAKKPKKRPVDIVLVALQLLKNYEVMPSKDFVSTMQKSGAPLDNSLLDEIALAFPGPKTGKAKTIDLKRLVDYMKRKWPDRELPPTPPTEMKPEVVPTKKKKKEKVKCLIFFMTKISNYFTNDSSN